MGEKEISKIIFWAVTILLIFLSYEIIKPYILAIISAFILAFLFLPLHKKLSKRFSKNISAAFSVLAALLIIIIPLLLLITGVTQQATTVLQKSSLSEITDYISSIKIISYLNLDLTVLKKDLLNFIISLLTSTIKYIPKAIISILIMAWSMFYILLNWDKLVSKLKKYIPLQDKKKVMGELGETAKVIVRGTLIIFIIEFIISAIFMYFLGIDSYLILATMIALLVFIPGLGPTIIWIPAALIYLISGNFTIGIGLIIMGIILSTGIETYLLGKIVERKAKINPLIRLVGVLGGVVIFGLFGFIIGPLILIYTIKILEGFNSKR